MKGPVARSLALLLLAGCAGRPPRLVVMASSVAQTVSLLGDTLYTPPMDPAGGPERVRRIMDARDAVDRDSLSLDAWLRLGRSTAEMGRLREAVDLYNRIAEVYHSDPRVYRERGEILLRLRHLASAISDFRKAGIFAIGRPLLLERIRGAYDSVPGQSAWANYTTVQFQIPMLLGFALYCNGEYAAAAEVLSEAAKAASTSDEISQAILWLFFAVRRTGDGSGASPVLALVKPEWAAGAKLHAIHLLLAYKGMLPVDSVRWRGLHLKGEERALYSYGLAYYLQLKPESREDAELWLEQARSDGNWPSLINLAAEADLARLRGVRIKVR